MSMKSEEQARPFGAPGLRHGVRAFHHGQMDCTIELVSPNGEVQAHLHYSVYDDVPHIQMIQVLPCQRRRGYATRMLADLQARHPEQEINWGTTTTAGEALRRALPRREVPTPEATGLARLARLRGRLAVMEQEIEHLRRSGRNASGARRALYCLEARVEELAWQLEDARPSLSLLDLTPPGLPTPEASISAQRHSFPIDLTDRHDTLEQA